MHLQLGQSGKRLAVWLGNRHAAALAQSVELMGREKDVWSFLAVWSGYDCSMETKIASGDLQTRRCDAMGRLKAGWAWLCRYTNLHRVDSLAGFRHLV